MKRIEARRPSNVVFIDQLGPESAIGMEGTNSGTRGRIQNVGNGKYIATWGDAISVQYESLECLMEAYKAWTFVAFDSHQELYLWLAGAVLTEVTVDIRGNKTQSISVFEVEGYNGALRFSL